VQPETKTGRGGVRPHNPVREGWDMFCRTYSALCCGKIYVAPGGR